ncbi:MAG TPA: hypothetical protein VFU46_02440 [Gemmatimonadales bacterium]|nr:hypothetical protein [Gemmatimonadales bacterium]
MNRLWVFLHLLGFSMWIGGGLGAMFAAIAAKRETRLGIGAVARAVGAIHRSTTGPGALITVLSGLILTMGVSGRMGEMVGFTPSLIVMQLAGLAAALLTLFVLVPTSARLARIDPDEHAAAFDDLRSRQRVIGAVSGTLALVALVAGALL